MLMLEIVVGGREWYKIIFLIWACVQDIVNGYLVSGKQVLDSDIQDFRDAKGFDKYI